MRKPALSWACFALVALFTSSASAQFATTQPVPEQYKAGFDSINAEKAKEHLSILAGDEFAGRGSGQDGFQLAAKWYAEQLEKCGFKPAGTDGTWFQKVPLVRIGVSDKTQLTLNGKAADVEFGMSSYVGESKGEGSVVFVNLADAKASVGSAEQFAGKIVVYKAAPSRRRFRTSPMPKVITDAKPAAMIRVTTRSIISDRVGRNASIPTGGPAVSVTVEDANKLASLCHLADDFFSETPESNIVIATNIAAVSDIAVVRETVGVPNVIGWFEGSDPNLKHEHVCIGAHLDHLGTRGKEIYYGADDNGSGSTALLQIAKALQTNPVKPKRSILMMVFSGEELGLLGSAYYADNPTKPMKDMVCMLNMDMVGRNEETDQETAAENIGHIHLVGSKRISTGLHNLTMDANNHIGFTFEYDMESVYRRSDHANFAKKGVPVTFVFGGFHPDYHKPTDTIEKIDFNKIVAAARLNYLCAMMAAEHGHFEKDVATK
ncbi:MAG: M28 family peptidase [Planctomycetaceae bacterium]